MLARVFAVLAAVMTASFANAQEPAKGTYSIGDHFDGLIIRGKIEPDKPPPGAIGVRWYPEAAQDAQVEGEVFLNCSYPVAGQAITDCKILDETPVGYHFADAALGMVPDLQSHREIRYADRGAVVLSFQYAFDAPAKYPKSKRIMKPVWSKLPYEDDAEAALKRFAPRLTTSAWAALKCGVDEKGRLAGCRALTEEPQGLGVDTAALALAQQFQMAPIDKDGQAVAGGEYMARIWFNP